MNISKKIENILENKGIKFEGAMYFDFNENDTKVTVYDMDYTTFNKKLIGYYLVPFNNFVRA